MSSAALQDKLAEAGLPFAPIMRPQDLPDDAHLAHNGFHTLTLPETKKKGTASQIAD